MALFRGGRGNGAVLLRGSAGTLVLRSLASLLMFFAHLVYARLLGVEGFGVFVLAIAWVNMLLLVGRQGFDLAGVRFVAAFAAAADWAALKGFLRGAQAVVLAGSLLIAAAFAVALDVARPDLAPGTRTALLLAAGAMPLLALAQTASAMIRGFGRIVTAEVPLALLQPALLLAAMPFAVWGLGMAPRPWLAVAGYVVATAAALAALWVLLLRARPAPLRAVRAVIAPRRWYPQALAMILVGGFTMVMAQSGAIVVGAFAGAAEAGIYGAAGRVANVMQMVVFALAAAIAPMVARLHAAGDLAELQRVVAIGVCAVTAVAAAAALAMFVAGGWVLGLFGADFVPGYPILVVLVAGQLVAAAAAPAGIVLNMTGHHGATAKTLAIAAAAYLALMVALVPAHGGLGAAIAGALVVVATNAALARLALRRLGVRAWLSPSRRALGV